ARCPLLAQAASSIGDVQVRNMGTIGGSVAHADPSADYPASLLALEAKVRLVSAKSDRTISLENFLVDTMTTALEPGEILQAVIGDGVDANSDLFASADYRTHMAQVYTARALKQALAGAS